jgi:hypothetical protein
LKLENIEHFDPAAGEHNRDEFQKQSTPKSTHKNESLSNYYQLAPPLKQDTSDQVGRPEQAGRGAPAVDTQQDQQEKIDGKSCHWLWPAVPSLMSRDDRSQLLENPIGLTGNWRVTKSS